MTFIESTRPDITETLPRTLSSRRVAHAYQRTGVRFDVEIGGLPFILGPTAENPYRRETLDSQRQQIDTSDLPGEQTLSQWWTRTQDSWHAGSGVTYYEPGAQEDTKFRFRRSVGVDVWTKGQVTLLRSTPQLRAATGGVNYVTGARVGSSDVVFSNENGTVKRSTVSAPTSYTGGTLTPTTAVAVCGKKIVVGTSDSLLIGDASGNTLANMLTAGTTNYNLVPYWAKARLIVTHGPSVHDVALTDVALPTALYTHPDADWTWTAVAEAPGAILAAGYGNGKAAVFRFTLEDVSGVPTLGAGIQAFDFPLGEQPSAMAVYLGTFLAVGTNRGVRIGTVDQDGQIALGPLTVETTTPVTSLTAADRFVYAAASNFIDGSSGCVRIDLSQQIEQELRFAWAYDALVHTTNTVNGITTLGTSGRLVFGVYQRGIYVQSATVYETTGYVETGRVRYGTTTPKAFVQYNVQAVCPEESGVSIYSWRPGSTAYQFEFRTTNTFDFSETLGLSNGLVSAQWIELKLELQANTDLDGTPTLESWTLMSLPHVNTQRGVVFPLDCFDFEQDRNGNEVGYPGAAADRLRLLEELERENAMVTVTDFTNGINGEAFSGVIRSVSFRRIAPPSSTQKNFGGVVTVTVLMLQ